MKRVIGRCSEVAELDRLALDDLGLLLLAAGGEDERRGDGQRDRDGSSMVFAQAPIGGRNPISWTPLDGQTRSPATPTGSIPAPDSRISRSCSQGAAPPAAIPASVAELLAGRSKGASARSRR